jgi:hypothetical protein
VRPAKTLFLIALMALAALLNARPSYAQQTSGIELENVAALVKFGEQITFIATIKSSLPILDASIIILDEVQGMTEVEPLVVQQDGRTEFRYDTRKKDLRPFSPVSWNYRITLPGGSIVQSEVYSTLYQDNRFDWQTLEAGILRVHWYGGDPGLGQSALGAAQSGLESVNRLIPTGLEQPVEIYIYSNLSDLRGTLVPGSQEWVAGHADPSLGVVMVAIEPGPMQQNTMLQRIPHELMHVMLYRAVGEGYRNIPAWLSEGTAGLAELVSDPGYDTILQEAVARRDWIPLSTLCGSFPNDTDRAFLSYAEARSFAGYLHEAYGSSGLLKLTMVYAQGADCKNGPELAFGIPLAKLEDEWHASLTGETPLLPARQNTTPYLVLLGLILIVPATGILSTMLGKRNRHGPETYVRK